MKTLNQTVQEVGTELGHKLFHDLMGGGYGQVPVNREGAVIALVFEADADIIGDQLEAVQEATKINLFALQAANIRKHAQGNEAKAKMVATIQTRADKAAVKAAREALATCSNEMTEAAKGGLRKVIAGDFCR
jgi:hypothetical protein